MNLSQMFPANPHFQARVNELNKNGDLSIFIENHPALTEEKVRYVISKYLDMPKSNPENLGIICHALLKEIVDVDHEAKKDIVKIQCAMELSKTIEEGSIEELHKFFSKVDPMVALQLIVEVQQNPEDAFSKMVDLYADVKMKEMEEVPQEAPKNPVVKVTSPLHEVGNDDCECTLCKSARENEEEIDTYAPGSIFHQFVCMPYFVREQLMKDLQVQHDKLCVIEEANKLKSTESLIKQLAKIQCALICNNYMFGRETTNEFVFGEYNAVLENVYFPVEIMNLNLEIINEITAIDPTLMVELNEIVISM